MTRRTGIPVAGVVPYIPRLRIAEEDSLALDERTRRARPTTAELDICVVRLPYISNYDDFEPLEHEPGVVVRFPESAAELAGADLVILPGSKSTVSDLGWLRESGIAGAIAERAGAGLPVLGICGGCQMLGGAIDDPERVESPLAGAQGLGLLPLRTRFGTRKITARVSAFAVAPGWLTRAANQPLTGYEIHLGATSPAGAVTPAFRIAARNGEACTIDDGAVAGSVVGTMIHGILANATVRAALLAHLRSRRALLPPAPAELPQTIDEYDRVAAVVRDALDPLVVEPLLPVAL